MHVNSQRISLQSLSLKTLQMTKIVQLPSLVRHSPRNRKRALIQKYPLAIHAASLISSGQSRLTAAQGILDNAASSTILPSR